MRLLCPMGAVAGTVLTAVLSPAAAVAQDGAISGSVTDQLGLPVPGVTVWVESGTTKLLATTDGQGRYSVAGLPAGEYTVTFSSPGRAPVVRDGVAVFLGGEVRLDQEVVSLYAIEGITVTATGTAFDEAPIDAPYAVSVVRRNDLQAQGAPQLVDLFKSLGVSHGVIGELESWYNSDQAVTIMETVANVNLRGLGASRTLVLLNGRRQVYVPARLYGGRFVDVNGFPAIALERIELLKEGASAVYGSDAVAGVANFLTRSRFSGFEASGSYEHISASNNSDIGAIWGGGSDDAHVVVSAEHVRRGALRPQDRDWSLKPFIPGVTRSAWSFIGRPGSFITPGLTGVEGKEAFVAALSDAMARGDVIRDHGCEGFGGYAEPKTCRFRYGTWDNLIDEAQHTRAFAELNGALGERTAYHAEALWSEAVIPNWVNVPSYAAPSLFDGIQLVAPDHPGRMKFCAIPDAPPQCVSRVGEDWFYFGRMVGAEGPERTVRRNSRTQRLATSLDHEFEFGGRRARLNVGASYSRAKANMSLPAQYAYRKFLAFRGFGGPDCGVGVVADDQSPSGMSLGQLSGARAGEGPCMYYNPFSHGMERSLQPEAPYYTSPNPDFVPSLQNDPSLIDWINEEVRLDNSAALIVADATLSGTLAEGVGSYAFGYQYRRFAAASTPNDPGNLDLNPCAVLGSHDCLLKTGPFGLTTGHYPYDDRRTVHRVFTEMPISLGGNVEAQLAANYEFHEVASGFSPKIALRWSPLESATRSLTLRGSLQTTFRTPTVDELSEDRITNLAYINETGFWRPIDQFGNESLKPEKAFTYNAGLVLQGLSTQFSADYWRYDFRDMIDVVPHAAVTALYDQGGATRVAVQDYVVCPGGLRDGSCDTFFFERVEVGLVNWPGVVTSGIDIRWDTRLGVRGGEAIVSLDGTYTFNYAVKGLQLGGITIQPAHEGAGYFNANSPVAPPIPRWKARASTTYHLRDQSFSVFLNHISAYRDQREEGTQYEDIKAFATLDASLQWRFPGRGFEIVLAAVNLTDAAPPYVNWEQSYDGFTHNPKGRQIKLALKRRTGR